MPANCCYCPDEIDEYSGASPVCSLCRERRRQDISLRVDKGETFADIGRAWSVSRERIRQIAKAMDIRSPVQIARELQKDMAAHAHRRYERMLTDVAVQFNVDTSAVEDAIRRHNAHTCLDCPVELTDVRRKRCPSCAKAHILAGRRKRYNEDSSYRARGLGPQQGIQGKEQGQPRIPCDGQRTSAPVQGKGDSMKAQASWGPETRIQYFEGGYYL